MPTGPTRRLIALDLDGTLLAPTGRLTERTANAVRATAAAGHHVVIATGRPPHLVDDIAGQLGDAVGHIVGVNGSMVCTFPDSTLLRLIGFDIADAHGVVTTLRSIDPAFGFSIATDQGFAHEPGFAARLPTTMETDPVDDVLGLGGSEVYKLFVFHPHRPVHDLIAELPATLPTHLAVTHMGADVAEIGPSAIDKRAGLAWLCGELGVDQADVIAFGDEWNDITMIEWAGHGVAMNNADSHVKAVADEIAPSNAADGVAIVLEAMLESLLAAR